MANTITILRVILAFVVISLLFNNMSLGTNGFLAAFIMTVIVIWFDGLDGYIARKFNESSKFGAMLDILGDRIVENIYWLVFAIIGWVPVWIPIVVLTRGLITDGLRSVAMEQGYTAFGSSTMMQSKIGKFIVASNLVRGGYAVLKAVAFCFLILANMRAEYPYKDIVTIVAYFSTYVAVFLCVLRGIPVIIESKRFFPKSSGQ